MQASIPPSQARTVASQFWPATLAGPRVGGSISASLAPRPCQTYQAPPLRGLGQSVADIERLLGDDPEALERLREELTATKGNPAGVNQYSGKDNNIIPSSTSDLFAEPSAKPKRQKKTQQGTRKDYTLSRLKKTAPCPIWPGHPAQRDHAECRFPQRQTGFSRGDDAPLRRDLGERDGLRSN